MPHWCQFNGEQVQQECSVARGAAVPRGTTMGSSYNSGAEPQFRRSGRTGDRSPARMQGSVSPSHAGKLLVHVRSRGGFLGCVLRQSDQAVAMHGRLGDLRAAVGIRRRGVLIGVRRVPLRQRQEVLLESAVIGGCARLGRQSVELLIGRHRRPCASFEAGARRWRRRCGTRRQFLVVRGEFTQLSRRLRIEIRELLAVRAHAGPKIAAWVANEALRHRRVPLGFGCIAIRESSEVCREARVIARLGPLDELLHFECVQERRGFVLCCGSSLRKPEMRVQQAIVNGSGAFS